MAFEIGNLFGLCIGFFLKVVVFFFGFFESLLESFEFFVVAIVLRNAVYFCRFCIFGLLVLTAYLAFKLGNALLLCGDFGLEGAVLGA
ncbi:MAG: hypothetical protein ACO36I_01355 [Candidatus Latescibacterota bacterium]